MPAIIPRSAEARPLRFIVGDETWLSRHIPQCGEADQREFVAWRVEKASKNCIEHMFAQPSLMELRVPVPRYAKNADAGRTELDIPESARPLRLARIDATGIAAIHLVALLAFVPWFFSWMGVVLALLGLYVFGTLGISLCFHRMLAHRGVVCPIWLEHSLAILGLCCVQDTPARWVGIHRRHHEHADEQPDPHSPLAGFLWAHIGWMIFRNRELTRLMLVSRYAKDVMRDPFYAKLEQNFRWVRVVLISWLLFFASAFLAELVLTRDTLGAIQFGFSVLIWGVFVRTVLVWHIAWSVNSVTHLWGYRNYETDECSRNNLLIGFLSNGEGWHNNHHAVPRSARYGHRWWELDVTWLTIRLLSALGLAWKIVTPSPSLAITAGVDRHGASAVSPNGPARYSVADRKRGSS